MLFVTVVVLFPVCRGSQHDLIQRFDEVGTLFFRYQFLLHHAQREQSLTQTKGQSRTDLQDSNTISDHVVQIGCGLVVGRVTLEADVGELLQSGAQVNGCGGVVVEHLLIAKLHTGLDNDCDNVLHALANAFLSPDALIGGNGITECFGLGDSQRILCLGCTTGDGHFTADNEHRAHCIRLLSLQFLVALHSSLVQLCTTASDDLGLEQTFRVVCNLHAGIQMDLGKAGACILVNQFHGVFHCFGLRQLLPSQGSEVVACQNHHVFGQTDVACHFQDHLVEISGLHAGVAAKLVDLIGGCLDQNRDVALLCTAQGDLDYQFVGTAIRGDAAADTLTALIHHFLKGMFHFYSPFY